MAVYYKGQRMPWFIPGMKSGEEINLDPATFDPSMLPQGRIDMGKDLTMIRIPDVPNRIRIRKGGYVELILETHYDKDTKQSRNKKVIIGTDQSDFLPGMMTPNDNYHNLFDGRGRLYDDPMKKKPIPNGEGRPNHTDQPNAAEQGAKEQPEKNKESQTTKGPKTNKEPKESKDSKESPQAPNQSKPEGKPTDTNINADLQLKLQILAKKEIQLKEKESELNKRERELTDWEQELEKKEEDLFFEAEDADKDHIKLLSYILDSYKETIDHQAKKKPDAPMTQKQIQTINQILSELKEFFTGCETDNLLHLAEEPDPTTDTPGTTNGEMALLLSAYQFTINAYKFDELRNKK